ncbi:MAG: permease [Pirellulaceae bacterium]|nr:MAG: permease [Pirellulaceae bacterium]
MTQGSVLTRKLVRELWATKGQALAIAAVVAAGVAVFVMSTSILQFLRDTRDTYYDRYRFAHVFAQLRRAPRTLEPQIAAIDGVTMVDTRVVADVTIDVPGLEEPAAARLISIPSGRPPRLNAYHLRRGRQPDPAHGDEVLVSEAFYEANRLQLGDSIAAIINGRYQRLRIVGVALSPEYVFQIRPGALLPDDRRFGVMWMPRQHLEAAFNMEGAFNDVALRLQPGSNYEEVLDRLDLLLKRYGCTGAYGREDQISASFLDDEIQQLRGMAIIAPMIFLGVAAFLLNVILSRRVQTQREIIAALKAFGFGNSTIAMHYLATAVWITAVGAVVGTLAGSRLAVGLAQLYSEFYRFPHFEFHPDLRSIAAASLVSLAAAVGGAGRAVWQAVRLMPAEAMRPPTPARYHRSVVEVLGLSWLFPLPLRMILRHLQRRPLNSLFSVLGIAAAVAVLLMGNFSPDAIHYLLNFQFEVAQRHDVQVVFEPLASHAAIHELKSLPGVQYVEGFRSVPVHIRRGHRKHRTAIMGLGRERRLYRLLNAHERPIRLPPEGLVLSDALAKRLRVSAGERVEVEILDGRPGTYILPVVGVAQEYAGMNAYADIDALHRLLQEDAALTGAWLQVDSLANRQLYQHLKHTPRVGSVAIKKATMEQFKATIAENVLTMQAFNVLFAAIIAIGVIYNTARISLDERARELMTLRVIGFSRWETSAMLLGELAVLTCIAIPVGWAVGYSFCYAMVQGFASEQFRIPLVIHPDSYLQSAAVAATAAIVSGWIVHRRLEQIDLVEVLKIRE